MDAEPLTPSSSSPSDDRSHASEPPIAPAFLPYAEPAGKHRKLQQYIIGLIVALILLGMGLLWITVGIAVMFEPKAPMWFGLLALGFGCVLFFAGLLHLVGNVRRLGDTHERSAFFAIGYWFINRDFFGSKNPPRRGSR